MMKRFVCFAVLFLAAASLAASNVPAQESDEALMARKDQLRKEREAVTAEYKTKLYDSNYKYDRQLADIKKEFHDKRDACLREKAAKGEELTGNYKAKTRPILAEEQQIAESLARTKGMNFAKPKAK